MPDRVLFPKSVERPYKLHWRASVRRPSRWITSATGVLDFARFSAYATYALDTCSFSRSAPSSGFVSHNRKSPICSGVIKRDQVKNIDGRKQLTAEGDALNNIIYGREWNSGGGHRAGKCRGRGYDRSGSRHGPAGRKLVRHGKPSIKSEQHDTKLVFGNRSRRACHRSPTDPSVRLCECLMAKRR